MYIVLFFVSSSLIKTTITKFKFKQNFFVRVGIKFSLKKETENGCNIYPDTILQHSAT